MGNEKDLCGRKSTLSWLIAGLLVGAWALWRIAQRTQRQVEETPPSPLEIPSAASGSRIPPSLAEAEAQTPDDLTRVEGIGPKVAGLLQANGIKTYAHLAATDVSRLRDFLREQGLQFMNPATWPQQAGLAAAEDWDNLETLQNELKGGRR